MWEATRNTYHKTNMGYSPEKLGFEKVTRGLVLAGVDADDVALWNTWATVSSAHINKATLASLGSRSWCRCQRAESHGLPAWHCWVPTLMIWSFYRHWWDPCMLIAWIESHDPDVKAVRFTSSLAFVTWSVSVCALALSPRHLVIFPPFNSTVKSHIIWLRLSRSVRVSDISRGFLLSGRVATDVERSEMVSARTDHTLYNNKKKRPLLCFFKISKQPYFVGFYSTRQMFFSAPNEKIRKLVKDCAQSLD